MQENDGGIVKKRRFSETIPQSAMLTAPFTQGSLWSSLRGDEFVFRNAVW